MTKSMNIVHRIHQFSSQLNSQLITIIARSRLNYKSNKIEKKRKDKKSELKPAGRNPNKRKKFAEKFHGIRPKV